MLLSEALRLTPEVAPVLGLGAVTGMRRGELVGLRRSNIDWDECHIRVNSAVSETKQVKGTKTRRERAVVSMTALWRCSGTTARRWTYARPRAEQRSTMTPLCSASIQIAGGPCPRTT